MYSGETTRPNCEGKIRIGDTELEMIPGEGRIVFYRVTVGGVRVATTGVILEMNDGTLPRMTLHHVPAKVAIKQSWE